MEEQWQNKQQGISKYDAEIWDYKNWKTNGII